MLRRVLEITSDGIFLVQDGRVRECNGFMAVRGGYRPDEVLDTCFASFFHRDSVPAVEAVCDGISPEHDLMTLPKAVLMCKNGRGMDVRLKACRCRLEGKAAVLVALNAAAVSAAPSPPDPDLDGLMISEEAAVGLSAYA
jgi:hypothetical protein